MNKLIIVGSVIAVSAVAAGVYELFFANPTPTASGGNSGLELAGNPILNKSPMQKQTTTSLPITQTATANGINYTTNVGKTSLSISGSGQKLNPGSTIISGSVPNPYIVDKQGYITSLNTSNFGKTTSAPVAVTGGSYAGVPTTIGSTAGETVQNTSNGFYKVTTPTGAIVYTKINPNG